MSELHCMTVANSTPGFKESKPIKKVHEEKSISNPINFLCDAKSNWNFLLCESQTEVGNLFQFACNGVGLSECCVAWEGRKCQPFYMHQQPFKCIQASMGITCLAATSHEMSEKQWILNGIKSSFQLLQIGLNWKFFSAAYFKKNPPMSYQKMLLSNEKPENINI